MKWKINIYFLMGVVLISYTNAQGLGNCALGDYALGNCIIQQQGGGGGGGGFDSSIIPIGEYLNIFKQWTLSLFKQWFFTGELPVLAYRIETPVTINQGDILNVNNLFTNEVENLSVEVHCINFFDANKNGIIDLDDPQASFNKKAESKTLNNITTHLDIPNNQSTDNYLVAGKCELGVGSPNATSSRKIQVKGKTEAKEYFTIPKTINLKNVWVIAGLIAILALLLFFGTQILSIIMGSIGWITRVIIGFGMIGLIILGIVLFYLWWRYLK